MSDLSQKALNQLLTEANIASIASTLEHHSTVDQLKIFNLLSAHKAERVLPLLEPVTQANIIQGIAEKKALTILEKMEPDDRARLFHELSEVQAEFLLKRLSDKERHATHLLLTFPEETAGRIMSPFYAALKPEMTVAEALAHIRAEGEEAETIYMLPVVDADNTLIAVLDLARLVTANPEDRVESLMSKEFQSFSVQDDQEELARFIQATGKLAVPVVDEEKHLRGIVTFDDALDVLEMEETEDIIRAGASEPLGRPYLRVSVMRLMKSRVIWLIFLAFAGTLTVNVLHAFSATLNQNIVLALFIPLLVGIGGNTGSQASTTIVRALAMDHIRLSDFLLVVGREALVGVLLGLVLGCCAFTILSYFFPMNMALTVGLSLVLICTFAALAGAAMPLFARLVGLDPAVVSTPFVSTVIDATGLMIYFTIARVVLHI